MQMHITERAVRAVVVPDNRKNMVVFDTEQLRFGVNITRNGPTSYVILFRDHNGKQRQEKLATFGQIAPTAARSLAKQRLAEIEQQTGGNGRRRQPASPTLDTFFYRTFLPLVKSTSHSYPTHASLYRNHLQPELGDRQLAEITSQDIVDFHQKLQAKPVAGGYGPDQAGRCLAPATVNRILVLVRHIFNEAMRHKVAGVTENPTKPLQLTTKRRIKGMFLNREQLTRLTDAAEELGYAQMRDIIRVMTGTGMRRGSALQLQWSWFDGERGLINLPPEADKAKHGYTVYLAEEVADLLRERQRHATSPYVFPNPKTGRPYGSCYNSWNSIRKRTGLPELRMHDLRHTFASLMLGVGADIIHVQRSLGHTQIATTTVYLHLLERQMKDFANATVQEAGMFAA